MSPITIRKKGRIIQYFPQYCSDALQVFFHDPEFALAQHTETLFKNKPNDTSTVALVRIDGRRWVVKRYNIKSFAHRIKRALSTTKARISWNNAVKLQSLGIPSIQPVALVEHRCWGFTGVSYLITEYQEGVLAADFFMKESPYQQSFPQAIHNLIDLIKSMKNARIVHDDFQLLNLLMVGNAPVLLDLDHMRHYKTASRRFLVAHQQDIDHLAKKLQSSPVVHRMFVTALQTLNDPC